MALGNDDTCKEIGNGSVAIKIHDRMIRTLSNVKRVSGVEKEFHISWYI